MKKSKSKFWKVPRKWEHHAAEEKKIKQFHDIKRNQTIFT